MDLGQYASYRLPTNVATAFGVTTAQELADAVGAQGTFTSDTARLAEAAHDQARQGDPSAARRLLVEQAGLSEADADAAIARLAGA